MSFLSGKEKAITISKYLQERKNLTSKGKYIVKAEDKPLK